MVSTGVDVGLAAIGVPPTLPNFDKLMDEGADYLAATVADESGIPGADIVTKEALKQGIKDVAKGMQNVPNSNDVYGLQPDLKYLYQPAHLMIDL